LTDDIGRELAARAANDWKHAGAFFAVVERDVRLGAELDALVANPATPLLSILPTWQACPEEGRRFVYVVRDNAHRLDLIVREKGWPGLDLAGVGGADSAWLIAQHADLENVLRTGWVHPLEQAVRVRQADPRHLACLVDRIAVVDGAPQVYGTVAMVEGGELVLLHRLREPGELDRRRRSIGLPAIAADVSLLAGGEIIPFGPDRQDHPLMRWP
jgi:hypothetical protein